MEMDAAKGEVAAVDDFFDIDSFSLDDIDFDLAADEFCDAYAAFVADAEHNSCTGAKAAVGWLAGSGIIDAFDGSSRESTPDSGVTDGPFAGEGSSSLSEYVSELERFLMENNDDDDFGEVVACPTGGEGAAAGELSVSDYSDCLLAAMEDADGAGGGAEEEEILDAREGDETASRKRARHKIRGTTMTTCSWEELEVTRRHLARMPVLPTLWLPVAPPLRCV